MFKLMFFVPEPQVEEVKFAVFDAGAGRIGNYDCCAWQTLGTGQFRPLPGSNPFIGSSGYIERVPEFRVEVLCRPEVVRAAIRALIRAHPYEEPAYEVYRVWLGDDLPSELDASGKPEEEET
ncbi:MAG: NGG1p interacting factor NIF3 [Spirochaetales bacterium]|nr:NGG1p interacting factor NIF3 [Spirochaetales bacterium]